MSCEDSRIDFKVAIATDTHRRVVKFQQVFFFRDSSKHSEEINSDTENYFNDTSRARWVHIIWLWYFVYTQSTSPRRSLVNQCMMTDEEEQHNTQHLPVVRSLSFVWSRSLSLHHLAISQSKWNEICVNEAAHREIQGVERKTWNRINLL